MSVGEILQQAPVKDISFRCPACNGKLVVDASVAGELVYCPKCTASIVVPDNDVNAGETDPALVQALEDACQQLAAARRDARKASQEAAKLYKSNESMKQAAAEAADEQLSEKARVERLERENADLKQVSKTDDQARGSKDSERREGLAAQEDLRKQLEETSVALEARTVEAVQLRAEVERLGQNKGTAETAERLEKEVVELRKQLKAKGEAHRAALVKESEAGAEAERANKAQAIQQAAADLVRQDLERRHQALTEEVVRLRGQLEEKDRSMREVVDGARTPVDLGKYRNPAIEKLAAAQMQEGSPASPPDESPPESSASEDNADEPPADDTLTPLKAVGEDILPRYTSPRPYYHELPPQKQRKSKMLLLGWILAAFGIITMILSPAKLAMVYAPPVAAALVLGMILFARRRSPMVAGLIFLTLLIPAMVWFGVEQSQFKGLAPDIDLVMKDFRSGAE